MKSVLSFIVVFSILFVLVGCSVGNKDENNKKALSPDSLSVCLSSEPDSIDPALNSTIDGSTLIVHLFSGLAKWSEDENGNDVILPELALNLPEPTINETGTVTYIYKLRKGLKWSNSEPLTADDFVFSWNRAASPLTAADYSNMFSYIDGYDEMWATDENGEFLYPDAKLNLEAIDENTLKVTLKTNISYWNELLAFPTFYPVYKEAVADDSWASDADNFICNGPYILSQWKHKSSIALVKNKYYYAYDDITMPKIKFFLSDNETNIVTNYKTGDWLFIDNVPVSEIEALREKYKDEFYVAPRLGTYYLAWNINQEILPENTELSGVEAEKARSEIRKAISMLIERNYIVNYISKAGEYPATSFISRGLTDASSDLQFYENAGIEGDGYIGYYDIDESSYSKNCVAAENILKKYYSYDEKSGKFTDFPKLEYIYNTDDNHRKIAEYVYNVLKLYGIEIVLRNEEWNTFIHTRKQGDYTLARNGWIADYNDPISFLDLWQSDSGNNDIRLGKGEHKNLKAYSLDLTPYGIDIYISEGTWKETYDVLIDIIKRCTDNQLRYKLMHLAEDMLMDTGCIMPLYYYSDIYMLDSRVKGFYTNTLGYKYFMYTRIEQ